MNKTTVKNLLVLLAVLVLALASPAFVTSGFPADAKNSKAKPAAKKEGAKKPDAQEEKAKKEDSKKTATKKEESEKPAAKPAKEEEEKADPPRQVRIRARILEWSRDTSMDWGFTLGFQHDDADSVFKSASLLLPSQHDQFNAILKGLNGGGDLTLDATIQALEHFGEINVLVEPNIVVAPGSSAKIATLSKVPYVEIRAVGNTLAQITSFKDTSTQMTITLDKEIIQDQFVVMEINASVVDLSGYLPVGEHEGAILSAPRTETRRINTHVLVADRQILIIGILKTTSDTKHNQGVPWIARIPLLGFFFKNQATTSRDQELLFLVQPEIIRD